MPTRESRKRDHPSPVAVGDVRSVRLKPKDDAGVHVGGALCGQLAIIRPVPTSASCSAHIKNMLSHWPRRTTES